MNSNAITYIIIVILLLLGWISYWLYRWKALDNKPVESDEEAQFVADIRNNISKEISSVFCAVHRTSLDDKNVEIFYNNVGYSSTMMFVGIANHWLKAYFNWARRKVRLEFYVGGDKIHTTTVHYSVDGILSTEKMLKIFEKRMEAEPEFSADKYDFATLLQMSKDTRDAVFEKADLDDLIPAVLQYYTDNIQSIDDVAVLSSLMTIFGESKKAREILEKYAASLESDSDEKEDE